MMLFIGPAVSRALEHSGISTPEMPMMDMSHSEMDGMPMMDMSHPMGSGHVHSPDMGVMDDIACGYCVMLLHVPLLDLIVADTLQFVTFFYRAPPARYFVKFVFHPVLKDVQPRAPPFNHCI